MWSCSKAMAGILKRLKSALYRTAKKDTSPFMRSKSYSVPFPSKENKPKRYPYVIFATNSNDGVDATDDVSEFRVYQLTCKRECFPQFLHNSELAMDIHSQYNKLGDQFQKVPNEPTRTDKIRISIVTTGDIANDVSLIMGTHRHDSLVEFTVPANNVVVHIQDSSCVFLFLHKNVRKNIMIVGDPMVLLAHGQAVDVTIVGRNKPVNVVQVDSMTSSIIRRQLTHALTEALFTYAEEVQKRIDDYKKEMQSTDSHWTAIKWTEEALTVLLNNRSNSTNKHEVTLTRTTSIPDGVTSALNGMKDNGVLAYGILPDSFMVLVDEIVDEDLFEDTRRKIHQICKARGHFGMPVKVNKIPKNFLEYTSIAQGHILFNKTRSDVPQWCTIGMVTDAAKPMYPTTQAAAAEGGAANTMPKQDERHTNIVVAITAGHIFKTGDDAYCYIDEKEEKLGKCIASLHSEGKMQYDMAVIEVENHEKCSRKFENNVGTHCDCILFQDTVASGTGVYRKRGDNTTANGVIFSPDFQLVDMQKAYLVKGRGDSCFSEEGDSGSIVFKIDSQYDGENTTVQLLAIVTRQMKEDAARKLGLPLNLSFAVRLDKCLQQLAEQTRVKIVMPKK